MTGAVGEIEKRIDGYTDLSQLVDQEKGNMLEEEGEYSFFAQEEATHEKVEVD